MCHTYILNLLPIGFLVDQVLYFVERLVLPRDLAIILENHVVSLKNELLSLFVPYNHFPYGNLLVH